MQHFVPEELNRETFRKLGDFEDMLTLGERFTGGPTTEGFFPDALQFDNNGKAMSFSICRVSGTPTHIKAVEYHSESYEGILPLDGDIYMFAAPPWWFMKLDEIKIYRVPRGTMVKLKPGVVHGTVISADGSPVNVLVALPERTYSNDCVFTELKEEDWILL
jgi:ureidoglycolate lyase